MYSIVRIIIGFILFACSIVVIRKFQTIRKRSSYAIAFVTTILIIPSVLGLFPFENLFITFDTPEDAYNYNTFGDTNVQLVLDGEDCAFIVDFESSSKRTIAAIAKSEKGWKLDGGSNIKLITSNFVDGISIDVYQFKDTNDYFINVFDMDSGAVDIFDDYNTEFYLFEHTNTEWNITDTDYFAYIPYFNNEYSIVINGNRIPVKLN